MDPIHRWIYSLFGIVAVATYCSAQVFYVAAPNALRPGADETVAVTVDGTAVNQTINVYFQDYPGRSNKMAERNVQVAPGKPEIIQLRVEPEDLPEAVFTDPTIKHYVVLVAKSGNFAKEVILPISSQVGYVFLQTDKPIYTPKQNVKMRIIPLNEEALPSEREFRLQIRNPQNIIVEEINFNQRVQEKKKEFISYIYTFPQHPVLGEWSATVLYGFQLQQNNSVTFQVQEYVLPTFTVKVTAPDVILPKDNIISGSVESRFVYGKKVQGTASFKFGVKDRTGNVHYFGIMKPKELREGIAQFSVSTDDLKLHPDIGWFPAIEGRYLVIEATVMDRATGSTEMAMDDKGRFSSTPFLISFKRCLKDFKPGLVSVIEADITYVNGIPAEGVTAVISAVANNNKPMKILNPSAVTDEEGKVSFKIQPEIDHTTVTVTVRTNVPEYDANTQATAQHTQNKFQSRTNGYIAIARSSGTTLTPGAMFAETVHFEPAGISDVYYMVVTKGKIEMIQKFPEGKFKEQIVEFPVTFNMVPSFRLVVFAMYNGELIVDSLKVDVEKECKPEAKVVLEPDFPLKEPGNPGKIIMRGYKETLVGLLAVDEAVYALRKKDLLTKTKMFKTMEMHDLGCGPGGGQTTDTVLGNAGVVIMTNSYSPPDQRTVLSCEERIRRKREIVERIAKRYRGPLRECCILGVKRHHLNATCEERAAIVESFNITEVTSEECAQTFLECCVGKENATNNRARSGVNLVDDFDFVDIDEEEFMEKQLTVRSDFRETWIFEDKLIGPDYIEEFQASLPHSITTWVIQAVSVHKNWGMCVSRPENLVSFKKMFVQLNLPYSVVRNEQIEVQATVFNYGLQRLPTVVYMYGVKDLCTGTQEGEKSERKRIFVEAQSAQTVSFPVIPLKDGSFDIRVTALSAGGSDAIMRKLNVVPEGETVERSVPIKLDPSNQQRRTKRHINTEYCTDSIDESQNLQVSAVKLTLPQDFIPGTESCVVTALGDEFGPSIETTLHDPDRLLLKPHGCGEQTMVYLAPTVYTMHYLKATDQVSPANEEKGYGFIREGYGRELTFRKADGSYAAWVHRDASTWLTAFVIKVFCQANNLVHIDQNVMCSGVRWLTERQQVDGSFLERSPVIHQEMIGGVNGLVSMTAFVLITLQECNCEVQNLLIVKARAKAYLEANLDGIADPYTTALVAYALALTSSESSSKANEKLLALGTYNQDSNTLFWSTGGSTRDIETTAYALLTQLQHNNMVKSLSIVNWLNTKRIPSGSYPSTQDTVMAIQALSEYAIKAKHTGLDIVSNITSSNDRTLHKRMVFDTDNALVMQQLKIDKIGGTLFIKTTGRGVGLLSVKLRYNIPRPAETLCKFDMVINVKEVRIEKVKPAPNIPQGDKDVFDFLPDDLIRAVGADDAQGENAAEVEPEIDPRARPPPAEQEDQPRAARIGIPPIVNREERNFQDVDAINNDDEGEERRRFKRDDNDEKNTLGLEIQICAKFLGQKETGMTILDVGIFTGFLPKQEDLEKLLNDKNSLVDKYELSSRGIVFYLEKTPYLEPVCLKFRIKRDYIVGNTQTSIIKIYDYYNPDDSCTKFYSPDQNSPMLRKICENGICQCAEGGCPPSEPFAEVIKLQEDKGNDKRAIIRAMREKLKEIACDKHDYVWKGKAESLRPEGGFIYITFRIESIFKPGIEGRDILERQTRELLVRDNCDFAKLVPGQTYVIMGKDGEKYENTQGEIWYRYLMDKTTSIYLWKEMAGIKNKDKPMQLTFNWLERESAKNICDQ